ncbi:trypsin-like peptidase domain-containing protein [Polaromonas sp. P1(28)-13]|nr:trypsin-like peptidase domain-containing protein [Polaromonas sp. P1(28)-13]
MASRSASVVEISTISSWARSGSDDPEPEFAPSDSFGDRLAWPLPAGLARSDVRDLASGFILTSDGYVISSAHVLSGAEEAQVRLQDGRHFPARLIGLDRLTDVALLKIEAFGLSVAPIGDSSRLAVGDWVAAIGSPFGFPGSVTAGIVSAKNRFLSSSGETAFIQTDVAINPGSSGSPLFNASGEVVGLNSLIYSGSGGYMGVSFSVPINLAVDIARRLRSQGRVRRAYLGAQLQGMTPALAKSFGVRDPTGVLVVQVAPGGPAEQAGLRRGDIITAFEGNKVRDFTSLALKMSDRGAGIPSVFEIWRRAQKTFASVTLAEAATGGSHAPPPPVPANSPTWV